MESEIPYRAGLALLLAALAAHRAFLSGPFPGAFRRPDKAAARGLADSLFPLLGTAATLLTLLYLARPDPIAWSNAPFPAWVRWAGMAVGLSGLALLHAAQRALGAGWSAGTTPPRADRLVTAGPYRRMRHPIYTALLMIFGATLFISANWLVGAAWIAAVGIDIGRRVREEEARLRERFGQQYEDYVSSTGRFLPRPGRSVR